MKQNNLLKSSMMILLMFFAITSTWGQTTVTYSFNGGSTSGDLDANISFTTHRNGGTADPVINSGKLRLYQNTTKGGSIKVNAKNGVEITRVAMNVDTTGDGKGPRGYSVDNTTEAGTFAQGTNPNVMNVSANSYVEYYSKGSSSSTRTYVSSFSVTYVDSVAPCDTPSGTINEDIQEVNVPNTATFTVNDAADYTSIQWERSIDGGTSWSAISGATGITYTTGATTTAMDGYMFRAELTNAASGCTVATFTTNEAMLFVTEIVTAPVLEDATLNGTVGTSFNYNIVNSGGTATYTIVDGELPTGLTLTGGTISGTPTVADGFIVEVEGTNEAGSASAIIDFTIAQGTQTLVGFQNLSKTIADPDFTLPLTTNAGFSVVYESTNNSVASITGNTVSINGIGTTTINASAIDAAGNWTDYTGLITLTVTEVPLDPISIAGWNFPSAPDASVIIADCGEGTIYADGSNGSSNWTDITGFAGSALSVPCEGSVASSSLALVGGTNNGNNGKGIVFEISMLNYQDLNISYATRGTSAGFTTHVWSYSTDGVNFTNFRQYNDRNVTSFSTISITELTSNPTFAQAINGQETVYIKLILNGATNATGNNRIDNVNFIATPTPPVSDAITWTTDNEWSNGTGPVSTSDDVVIEGTLTTSGDLLGKNLTVVDGGSLTIASGNTVTLAGKITNESAAANFVVESGANLIQDGTYTANDNEGEITVLRDSQPMKRLDYTMWSSPVAGQQLQAFSPMTLPNRIYTYEGVAVYVAVPSATVDFMEGKGYLFRSPNDYHATNEIPYLGKFVGVPFNGNVTIATIAGTYTSIGNPYPSNIDADVLLAANSGISTLYFWNNTGVAGSNYATYTNLGGTAAAGGSATPTEFISVGQGFLVETTDVSVNFDNSMRVADAATFFKAETEKHRIWLNLNNEQNEGLNQILFGYIAGATNNVDHQIDGKLFASETSALYNIIGEEKFAIQGKSLPFQTSDVVILGFKAAEAGKFNISLANFDGLFAEGNVKVYLKDKDLNITHNLMESAYAFESAAGEFKTRFEVVYETEEVMGTEDLTANAVQIYTNNDQIVVSSKSEKILSVELFDLQGRNIHSNNKVNATSYEFKSASKGVLVVKVQTQNGEIITKKVISK